MVAEQVPRSVLSLLWDVDPTLLDLDRNRALIFERVMTRGTWEAMQWLRARYAPEAIVAFLDAEGARRLTPRDLAYWGLIAGRDVSTTPGGGRPRWAGV
jgi:hypothetical protein